MKRLIAFVLSASMLLTLTACGGAASSAAVPASSAAASSQGGTIEVDENLLTVEITIPASFFEMFATDEEPFDANAYAADIKEEESIIDAWANGDNSVTFKITKGDHRDMMAEMRKDIENVASVAENFPFVQRVETNEDCTLVKVYVPRTEYETGFNFFVLINYEMQALLYQAFNGTSENNVVIEAIDAETNEVIDMVDSAEQADA